MCVYIYIQILHIRPNTAHDNSRVKQATSSCAGTWIASFPQTLHQHLVDSAGAFASWCLVQDAYQTLATGNSDWFA